MAVFRTLIKSDLQKPLVVQQLSGNMFTEDNASNEIAVEVTNGGEPVALSGAVTAYAVRADGVTAVFTGTISGNVASVILPASCYVEVGTLSIVVKVGANTVGACTCYVYRTTTDEIVDPGHVIPSIDELLEQIEACRTATTNANTAASSANTAATNANTKATLADQKAALANTAAQNANTKATAANTAATNANTAAGKINNMTVAATGLPAGAAPVATITEVDGHKHIAFQIPKGDKGKDFHIAKTFASISAMMAYTGTDLEKYDFAMIDTGSVEDPDTGKLYCYEPDKNPKWSYIGDLSGAQGIKGETGNGIASAVLNSDYTLTLNWTNGDRYTTTSIRGERGPQGPTGQTGPTGPTGPTGATPNISIGTVTDVPYGTPSSATMTGTPEAPVLNLQLQHGASGNETIDDTAGEGDTDKVWSADKTAREISSLSSSKGQPNGIAELDAEGIVPADQLPPIASPVDVETTGENLTMLTLTDAIDYAALHGIRAKVLPRQPLGSYDKPWGPGKGRNLLNPSQYSGVTNYGITFSKNSEGNLSISGRPDSQSLVGKEIKIGEITLPAGNYWLTTNCALDAGVVLRNGSGTMIAEAVESAAVNFTLGYQTKLNFYGVFKSYTYYSGKINQMILDASDLDYDNWEPYSHICPITEMSANAPTLTASGNDPWAFAGSNSGIYGCEVEGVPGGSGVLLVTHRSITSYAGETLTGRWWSSYESYADGATPTTGAQVVYELAEPEEIAITVPEMRVSSPHRLTVSWTCAELWAKYEGKTQEYIDEAVVEITERIGELEGDVQEAIDEKADAICKTIDTPSAIVTFEDGADDLPVKELKVAIEPVQDLNGYDYPWPAGGGKNKLQVTATSKTINGITFTINDDGSILANGTSTREFNFKIGEEPLDVGSYILSGGIAGGKYNTYELRALKNGAIIAQARGNEQTFELSENTTVECVIHIGNNIVCDNFLFKPMFRLASETDATFAPYSNICPISGWTGAKVTRTGKNLVVESTIALGYVLNADTGKPQGNGGHKITDFIKVVPGNIYTVSGTDLHKRQEGQTSAAAIRVGQYDENYVCVGITGSDTTSDTKTITVSNRTAYVRVQVGYGASNIQFEEGSLATAFEPYGTTCSITFPSAAGTVYGGSLTIHADGTGELVVDKAFFEIDGSGTGYGVGGNTYKYVRYTPESSIYYYGTPTDGISNMFTEQAIGNTNADIGFGFANGRDIRIRYGLFAELTIAEAKEWLAEHPVQVCYKIASPIHYQLAAPQVRTLLGLNHIWADTGNTNLITYPADTAISVDNVEKRITSALTNMIDDTAGTGDTNKVWSADKSAKEVSDLNSKVTQLNNNVIVDSAGPAPIVSITDGADGMPMRKVEVAIEPVQDLNGYDYPWPAGGGKNIVDFDVSFPQTTGGITITKNDDGSITVNGTADRDVNIVLMNQKNCETGTWTISGVPENSAGGNFSIWMRNAMGGGTYARTYNGNKGTINNETGTVYIYCTVSNGTTVNSVKCFIQLEKGSTATAWSPYSNICPITGWTGAKVTRAGVNIWDEQYLRGYYNASGAFVSNNSQLCTKNKISIVPNATYYLGTVSSLRVDTTAICYYDASETFISRVFQGLGAFTTPSNARYMNVNFGTTYGATYNHDISINYPSTDTDYHPYSGETYDITFPSEAGTVYSGNLTIHEDGTGELVVDRASVDLGTMKWNVTSAGKHNCVMPTGMKPVANSYKSDSLCSAYILVTGNQSDAHDMSICVLNGTQLRINDSRYNGVTGEEFKVVVDGVQLVYELASPVLYELTDQEVIQLLKGVNNVFADTGNTAITYPADTKLYIDRKITEAIANALNA